MRAAIAQEVALTAAGTPKTEPGKLDTSIDIERPNPGRHILPHEFYRTRGTHKFVEEISAETLQLYLEELEKCGRKDLAAKRAGMSKWAYQRLEQLDDDFKAFTEQAHARFVDSLHEEARRRAVDGWEEPLVSAGKVLGTVRKYDSKLLELMLKRHDNAFREHFTGSMNITGGIVVIPAQVATVQQLMEEDRQLNAGQQQQQALPQLGNDEPVIDVVAVPSTMRVPTSPLDKKEPK